MIRELARKWWRIEIGLADAKGKVLDAQWGPVPLAGNDFCRAVRASSKGRKRCYKSVKEIHKALTKNPRGKGPQAHTCHLGLTMIAGEVRSQGRGQGLLFACGFSTRELSRTRRASLRDETRALIGRAPDLPGERVPLLGREDSDRLRDLLEYGADEMAAYSLNLHSERRPAHQETIAGAQAFSDIVTRSEGMRAAVNQLSRSADSSGPLLLCGEAGTGKRALARALHQASPRRAEPFEVYQGSSDPQTAENRIFGQSRGGALGRTGLLENTRGGTLYLCADSWTAPPLQVKLLRYLQEGTLVPQGASRALEAEARVVLALEQDFDQTLARGQLRKDLADFLGTCRVDIPPLRKRREDLSELIGLLLHRHGLAIEQLPRATADMLLRYDWPGNATELEEEIRQLCSPGDDPPRLSPEDVSVRIRQAAGYGTQALSKALRGTSELKTAVAILERELIQEGLIRTNWNKSLLARQLGISRSSLLAKLVRYGLDRERGE